jgi:hypothetical protein
MIRGGGAVRYFAHISKRGAVKYGVIPSSIGVLEALHQLVPIGQASCVARDDAGLAVWVLRIGGQELAGRWVIVDREFRLVL